jgi:Glycosyl transferase family 2
MSATRLSRVWRGLVRAGSLGAVALTAHTAVNLRRLRVPDIDPLEVAERVSVLLPVRDEATRVAPCLASLLEQIRVPDLEIVVMDDGSTDETMAVARAVAGDDPRVRLLTATELPPGWLGKPHACQALADAATGSVLVFVDADVRLAPHGIAAAVGLLRSSHLQLVSPYPRQIAITPAERLVQPLLQWSWLTTLPLRLAERSGRPTLGAANGQFLVVDAETYRLSGGHAGAHVRAAVLDDVALLRAVKAVGGRGGVVDGTALAKCRMYEDWPQLRDGYTKSLWSAFGSRTGAGAAVASLGLVYVVPPVAALGGSLTGLSGYLAAVLGRYAVAERTAGRSLPDSLAHPASIAVFGWLTLRSLVARRRGTLVWRGRALPVGTGSSGAGAPPVRQFGTGE